MSSKEKTNESETSNAEAQKLFNISHMYDGYNILKFDPLNPTSKGACGKLAVFDKDNIEFKKTPDERYLYPSNMSYKSDPHTSWSTRSKTIETAYNLTESFSASYEIGGGGSYSGFTGSFSQSASYERISKATHETHRFIEFTQCDISLYTVEWETPKLNPEFIKYVKALPAGMETPGEKLAYREFVRNFGTHYANIMNFGGRGYKEYATTTDSVAQLLSEKANISIAAEVAFAISAQIGGQSEKAIELAKSFSNKSESTAIKWSGGEPRSSFNDWVPTVAVNPIPRKAKFVEISQLLVESLIDDSSIDAKRANLEKYLVEFIYSSGTDPVMYLPLSPKLGRSKLNMITGNGCAINSISGSYWLNTELSGSCSPLYIFDYDNFDRKDDEVKTNDLIGVLIDCRDSNEFINIFAGRNTLESQKGRPTATAVGGDELTQKSLIERLESIREKCLYKIIDPNNPERREPLVCGREYVMYNVNQDFYLPEVEVSVRDDKTYFALFPQVTNTVDDATRIRFLVKN